MEQYKFVYDTLDKMQIAYDVVEHPPAFTTEDADKYIKDIDCIRTKTLFLCNKKKAAFYLLVLDQSKRLDFKKFEDLVSEKKIRFCSPEQLMEKMQLIPGAVSLFGILNNKEKDIRVILDKEMLTGQRISFHPNDNTKTVLISEEDMYRFIEEHGFEYKAIEI